MLSKPLSPLFLATTLFLSSCLASAQEFPASGTPIATAPTQPTIPPDALPATPVTEAERTAILIITTTLDLHLIPATATEEAHATLTLRNTTSTPLARIPLQISSTLRWQSIAAATERGLQTIPFTQSPIATDADHTGYAQEAILTPAQPLLPGATLALSVFYAGEIRQSAARLELLGTPPAEAARRDWDSIVPTTDVSATALRGLGNVLWYPVASPAAILGDGNKLFALAAAQRAQNVTSTLRLRLTVEYLGDPPPAAIVDGTLYPLTATPDTDTEVVADTHGLATADIPAHPIGFRIPSLFLTAQRPITSPDELLTVVTPHPEAVEPYAKAAALLQPIFTSYLAPNPTTPVLLLDHPGEPFEDSAFLATELDPQQTPEALAPTLLRPFTHAFFRSGALWLDQGMPELMSLLQTERTQGREAALTQLQGASSLIALAEPGLAAPQPLLQATAEVFLRLKCAAVLWQLRELLGDDLFRQSLLAYRRSITLNPSLERDPAAFQKSLEKTSNRDLAWFFHDWVDTDPGLPDLTIVQATPRKLPAQPGKSAGYLVAVEVRNDGEAIADVPVILRAAITSASARLRIPPHASASVRILFQDTPQTVQVNDGSVPELRTTLHAQPVVMQ